MDVKKKKDELIALMRTEQDNYRAHLLKQTPEEILSQSLAYASREDILNVMVNIDLTAAQMEALISSATPLEDISQKWTMQDNPRYMEDISDAIQDRANDLIERENELRKSPVYKYSADYARDNNERDLHMRSHDANIACKEAIESAISNYHDGLSFDSKSAVRDVVEKFGYERTLYVLAVTVRNKEHDGRFSSSSKNWAHTFPVTEDVNSLGRDFNRDFVVQSHPALTEGFVTTARQEYQLSLPR